MCFDCLPGIKINFKIRNYHALLNLQNLLISYPCTLVLKNRIKKFFITYTIIRHYSQILSESFELLCDESSQEEWLSKRHEHWKRPRKRKKKATDIADLVNLTGKW